MPVSKEEAGGADMAEAGIQLYTLRDIDEPLSSILTRVAAAGFAGVEFAHRVREEDPEEIKQALDRTGLVPIGAHIELSTLESEYDSLLAHYEMIGCRNLILPHISYRHFITMVDIERLRNDIEILADDLEEQGFNLSFHNTRESLLPPMDTILSSRLPWIDRTPASGWEGMASLMRRNGGPLSIDQFYRSGLGRLLDGMQDRSISIELDIKHATAAGFDPPMLMDAIGSNLEFIHIADIARTRRIPPRFESVDPGTGMVDIPASIDAGLASNARWLIYEHDHPDDPYTALERGAQVMSNVIDISHHATQLGSISHR